MTGKAKSISLGALAFLIFAACRNFIPLHNMVFYVTGCVIFMVVALLSFFFLEKRTSEPACLQVIWSVAPIILIAGWMILFYIDETKAPHPLVEAELVRRTVPFPIWALLMVAIVLITLFLLRKKHEERTLQVRRIVRIAVSFIFTAVTAIQFYAPNILQDIQGGLFHSHAYTNSIINVCWLTPYSERMTCNYGHYGILYMPVLKAMHRLFNLDYLTGIAILNVLLAAGSILLFLYVLSCFAKQDVIFYLGMLAIGEEYFMLMQAGVYYQVHPHRMIFPILFIALALWEKKKNKKRNILAMVLLTLSIIWSTEVGLVTMAAFSVYRWVDGIADGNAFSLRKLLKFFKELLLYFGIPFVVAYLLVNLYNIAVGGPWLNLADYLFPLISEKGYISSMELPLPSAVHPWVGAPVLFLCFIGLAAISLLFAKEKRKKMDSLLLFVGVMGLGLIFYYINRAVEGTMFIIMFQMLILEAVQVQKAQDTYLEWKQNGGSVFSQNRFLLLGLGVLCTLVLGVMAFDSVYSMPKAWKASADTIWKRDELKEFADKIWVQVPPDAVSFGEGVPEILSMVDRDTHLHTTDWAYPDMSFEVLKDIRYDLEDEPWFFCSMTSLSQMQENYPGLTDHFYLNDLFEYNGRQYGFFRKNEGE